MQPETLQLLLQLSIAVPLVAALILAFANFLPSAFSKGVAFAGFVFPVIAALLLWCEYDAAAKYQGFAFLSAKGLGLEGFGIALKLGLNGVSLPLFLMAAIVGLAAGLYALQSKVDRQPMYLLLLLVMHGGLMGVFASVDIFFFYFFHELALIPTFLMVGIWGGRDRTYAAMKMTIYLTIGAMLSLAGLIALYWKSGAETFDLIVLRETLAAAPLSETLQHNIFPLLMFGFGILVSLWPLHTWAPLGYGAAPTSAAMLHAGVLKKFGLYALVQIAVPLLPIGARDWSEILIWLALGNVVIIGLVTLAQRDLKQMIGFASVMHVGYGFLAVACISVIGAGGAVLFMVAHGFSVALLFLLATCIHHRAGTFAMDEIGGLVKHAPVLAAFFLTAIMASIGVPGPGLLNFWSELTIFMEFYHQAGWMVILALLGVVISAIYGLRAVGKIFYGQPTESFQRYSTGRVINDITWSERLPAILLLAALVYIGLWPRSISDSLNESLQSIYPKSAPAVLVSTQP